jgi:hypothetical protein
MKGSSKLELDTFQIITEPRFSTASHPDYKYSVLVRINSSISNDITVLSLSKVNNARHHYNWQARNSNLKPFKHIDN